MQIYKKASTKNYPAANSMHVLFRRRVLKMIFYTNCESRRNRPKRSADAAKIFVRGKKIFMHSIYILINSHVWTRWKKTARPGRIFHMTTKSFARCNMNAFSRCLRFLCKTVLSFIGRLMQRHVSQQSSHKQNFSVSLAKALLSVCHGKENAGGKRRFFLFRFCLLCTLPSLLALTIPPRQINCNAKIGKSKYRSELFCAAAE